MNELLKMIGRNEALFTKDISKYELRLSEEVFKSSFLVLGGAGSIGQAVVKEIFSRKPLKLHVVDISENNMVELVRDIRSSMGYLKGDFKTFSIDIGSVEYDAFIESDGQYDYVLNLSALKHVRSEKDRFTLMRMIDVNVFNTDKTIKQSIKKGTKKYFCVSTDKATNPVNIMGGSKKIMEMFLMRRSLDIKISTARFANVAFSDGSLLHGFNQRVEKQQPLVAPNDVKRYFITPKESGELCLMSCIFGNNRDIFFPKLSEELHLISFSDIATRYINNKGYETYLCKNEDEARASSLKLISEKKWPCFFSVSDTTGEKNAEEFYTTDEDLDMRKFVNLGVIKNEAVFDDQLLNEFENTVTDLKSSLNWDKKDLLKCFSKLIPNFQHKEFNKNLEDKM